jgi:hypothetical protein
MVTFQIKAVAVYEPFTGRSVHLKMEILLKISSVQQYKIPRILVEQLWIHPYFAV